MTIRDMVRNYVLGDNAVTTLIDQRLKPDMLPQKTAYPAGVIRLIDTIRNPSLRTVAGLARARIQIDFYCDGNGAASKGFLGSRECADALGSLLRQRLDGFGWAAGADQFLYDTSSSPASPVRAWIRIDPEMESPEPELGGGLSRYSADFIVDYQTHHGRY
jgi:hypothetical protein